MKNLIEILKESKTSDKEITHYIQSFLRQDRENYEKTTVLILQSMMDFYKDEMDYLEDKNKIASGKQSEDYDKVADLYKKVSDAYKLF